MEKLLLLLTVTALLAGCGQKQTPTPTTKQSRFEARESGFSVAFPGQPSQKSEPQQSPFGIHQLHSYTYKVSPRLALLVTFEELPAAAVEDAGRTLQQSVRSAATLQSGTITAETDASQDGHPSRAYEIDCGTLVYQGRYVLAGRRLYNVAAFVSKKLETAQPKAMKTFFDSFQVLKQDSETR